MRGDEKILDNVTNAIAPDMIRETPIDLILYLFKSSHRSRQTGLSISIKSSFHFRFHRLRERSRCCANRASSNVS